MISTFNTEWKKGIVGYALNHKCTDVEIQRAQGTVMDSYISNVVRKEI